MEISTLHQKLLPCDMDSPFAFVSYSSADKNIVWRDVIELQQRGYNIWIDEANLDKSNDSWKDDALRAIEDYNCALLIFYVSRHSLTSLPCLNELDRTVAESTQETHLGKVDHIAIDAEQVGNMRDFIPLVGSYIENSSTDREEKSSQTRVLFRFKSNWFQENNEKVRIHPKSEPKRIGDYYEDIEKELNRNRREIRLPAEKLKLRMSAEKMYRYGVDCVINRKFKTAEEILKAGADSYLPSALLLAHMYCTGYPGVDKNTAGAQMLWSEAEKKSSAFSWKKIGTDYDSAKFYSEAIAFFLAHGERMNDPDSLFLASKMWIKKGCQSQALLELRLASELGSEKARSYLNQLYRFDEDEVYRHAYHDEAPVK